MLPPESRQARHMAVKPPTFLQAGSRITAICSHLASHLCVRKREMEIDSDRDRDRDRETRVQRNTDTQTHRHTDIQTYRHMHTQAGGRSLRVLPPSSVSK